MLASVGPVPSTAKTLHLVSENRHLNIKSNFIDLRVAYFLRSEWTVWPGYSIMALHKAVA